MQTKLFSFDENFVSFAFKGNFQSKYDERIVLCIHVFVCSISLICDCISMWDDDGSHSICICWEIFVYIYYKYCPRYTITISWINIKCIIKRYLRSLWVAPEGSARTVLATYNYWKCTHWIRTIRRLNSEHWSAGNNSLKLREFSNYVLL